MKKIYKWKKFKCILYKWNHTVHNLMRLALSFSIIHPGEPSKLYQYCLPLYYWVVLPGICISVCLTIHLLKNILDDSIFELLHINCKVPSCIGFCVNVIFHFSGIIAQSEVVGSYGNCIFRCIRNCQAEF